MGKAFVFLATLFFTFTLQAQFVNQETFGIRKPKNKKECAPLVKVLNVLPKEARLSARISQHDSVFLVYDDLNWFNKIFVGKNDGIAIDLVSSDQYKCEAHSDIASNWLHKGYLLPPAYKNALINSRRDLGNGSLISFVGKIPESIIDKKLEANFMILQNKRKCYYASIVNIDFHNWKLLKMGFYYDTLATDPAEGSYASVNKTISFSVPFDKNKSIYKSDDIQPLYDSLRLNDFIIRSISISAYTSVEGSYERNMALQNERVESIVKALQAYQNETIQSLISTSEDWVEFLEDISGSPYDSFTTLSKEEIKERLKSPELLAQLEPVLKKERKAVIELTLEKKVKYLHKTPDELKKLFDQTVAMKNNVEALRLQNFIFYKIRRGELPEEFIKNIELPESSEYASLLINNQAFIAEEGYGGVSEAIKAFNRLDVLLPNNPKIKYNLCVLKIKAWLQSNLAVHQEALLKEIVSLRKFRIHESLVKRLLINYHILLSEYAMIHRQYALKDKSVNFIYNAYSNLNGKDDDLVNLSKFFCNYSKFEWAYLILQPRTKAIDVSEELLFYYLSLTIYQTRFTNTKPYRITMLNAINRNNKKFCQLFNSVYDGGVTFQLLENTFLKKTFCESCNP